MAKAKKTEAEKPEAPEHKPSPCVKCGKDMRGPDGIEKAALSVGIANINEKTLEGFFQKQIGKYTIGESYGICFECLIDLIHGVK